MVVELMMSYRNELKQRVIEFVETSFAEHVITPLREDGLYRHYRCQKPGTGINGFDVITWPGFLCYCGDLGEFVFQRTDDMIAFMRGSAMSYAYAAEKCVASRDDIREFREEIFEEMLEDELKEHLDERREEDPAAEADPEFVEKLDEIREAFGAYESPHDAHSAMYESGLWSDDLPTTSYYTFGFLLCLHALKWFCDRIPVPASAT